MSTEPSTPPWGTPLGAPRDDRVDASGPDRLVFLATLLVGVAFLSSVFVGDESAIAAREASVHRIEQAILDREDEADEFDPRQAERDAATQIASLGVHRTTAWRKRPERAAGDGTTGALPVPPAPRVELVGDDTVIEVSWSRLDGVDGVHVHRAEGVDRSLRRRTVVPVADTRWTEDPTELRGTYVYALQAVRGDQVGDIGKPTELRFQLAFDWRILSVAADRTSAEIEVTPAKGHILPYRDRVGPGEEIEGTGLRVARIEAATEQRKVSKTVPVFNPDGTHRRDPAGTPMFRRLDHVVNARIDRVIAEPVDGGPPVERVRPR